MRRAICYILILCFVSFHCEKDSVFSPIPSGGSYDHNRNPGTSATDFLGSSIYKSLKIEFLYMPGLKPDPGAVNIFTELLAEHLNKPSGVFLKEKEIDPTLKTVFTVNDITGIESANREVFTTGNQMSACILFVSGRYYNGNVLGLAYKNTSICFFGEPFETFSGGMTDEDKISALALLLAHEFGHLLGLVDMGTPMIVSHRDTENGSHCNNSECIMHHTFEPNIQSFTRILPYTPSFDVNCINDIRANGGK